MLPCCHFDTTEPHERTWMQICNVVIFCANQCRIDADDILVCREPRHFVVVVTRL